MKNKKLLYILLVVFVSLFTMIINTIFYVKTNSVVKCPEVFSYSQEEFPNAIEHLEGALKIKTVASYPFKETDFTGYSEFITYLKRTYPNVFQSCELTMVNDWAILLKWSGVDKNLSPIVLTAHYDTVVYGSEVKHDEVNIYGNGAIDDKGSVISILEAVSSLLKDGFIPKRDIYLAFGCDEEIGGLGGASKIVEYFTEINIVPDFVLDEGQPVFLLGNKKISVLGIGEKGAVSVNVKALKKGGYSAIPRKETSVSKTAEMLVLLSKNPMRPTYNEQTMNYLKNNVDNFDFWTNFLVANRFLLKPILDFKILSTPTIMVNMGTTSSIVSTWASERRSIMPDEAGFIVDYRIIPGQTIEDVTKHLDNVFKDKDDISYFVQATLEPKELSAVDSQGYQVLKKSMDTVYIGTNAIPHFIVGAGDSRHYRNITDKVYSFLPAEMTVEEYGLMHSYDEYISIENFTRMMNFYKLLIKNYDIKK